MKVAISRWRATFFSLATAVELRYNEGEVLQVPNTKLTRQRWKDHMYYGKWIYIVLAIVAVFVTDLLYSTTEYRPPDERKVTVQFVGSSATMAETVEQTTEQILSAVLPMDETLELVEFFALNFSGDDSDYYGAQKFFVELAAGENDVYVGSRTVLNSIIDQGAALPLDGYIASGLITVPEGAQLYERQEPLFDEQGNEMGKGETRIYGFSTDPLVQMPAQTYMNNEGNYFIITTMSPNPKTAALAMQELYALWSQPLPEPSPSAATEEAASTPAPSGEVSPSLSPDAEEGAQQ